MNWAVYTLIIIHVLSAGVALAKHGEPRKDKYNFTVYLVAMVITYTLYYYAGMFN